MTDIQPQHVIDVVKFKRAHLAFHLGDGREVRQIGPYLFDAILNDNGDVVGGEFRGPARVYATQLRAHLPLVLAQKPIRALDRLEVRT